MRPEEQPGATHEETEQIIVRMIREAAASEEDQYREKWGRDDPIQIKDVKIKGSFPNTNIGILVADAGKRRKLWEYYAVWQDPSFKGPRGGYYGPGRMAGDILMLARGG